MLIACERFELASVGLTLRFAAEREVGLYYARVDGASWNTALLPRAQQRPGDWLFLCLISEGAVAVSNGLRLESGVPFVVTEEHIVTSSEAGPAFRSDLPSLAGVALRVRASDLSLDVTPPSPLQASPDVTRALREALEVMQAEEVTVESLTEPWTRLLDVCVTQGLMRRRPALQQTRRESSALARARRALFPILETLFDSPMLVDAMGRTGSTDRQLRRDILRLQLEYGFFDRGWRGALTRWRLTAAVLLLSSDALTHAQIAEAVGYGGLPAMDRAFKRAGLPPPSAVRARHREPLA